MTNTPTQLRASAHQRLTRTDDGHMSLALFTPVLEWVEQFRIETCQASEILGVDLIRFAFVGVDESQFAGIGHQDLMGAPFEQTANPGRVGTGLDCYAHGLL